MNFSQRNSRSLWAISLIIFISLLNLFLSLNTGLTIDEAHYSLYGQHLDWSYYDHPPMVGWIEALTGKLSSSEFGVRLAAWLFNLLNIASLYYLTKRFFLKEAAFNSIFLYLGAPLFCALGILFLPKTPSLFFSCWIAYFLCLLTEQPSLKIWAGLGLALGLAALSEYTTVLLALGVFVFLIWKKPRVFLTSGPYLAALLTLALITPVLIWNYQHEWISIAYQFNHGRGNHAWEFVRFLIAILVQIPAYGPALTVLGMSATYQVFKKWQDLPSQALVALAWPSLLVFAYSGGTQHLHLHWTATGWLLLIPLIARLLNESSSSSWAQRLAYMSLVWTGLVYFVCLMAIASLAGWIPPILLKDRNILQEVENIQPAAHEAVKLLAQIKSPHPMIFVNNRLMASRLAWYANTPVQIASQKLVTQLDFWYGTPNIQSDGILMVPQGGKFPSPESSAVGEFAHCQALSQLDVKVHEYTIDHFYFYHCWHFNAST